MLKDIARSLVYETLNLYTRGHGMSRDICGESVRFPPRWHRYYPAVYEPDTFAFLRAHCKPGATVMDIGAHFGLFTVVMARLVQPLGRVYSFEPSSTIRAVLEQTVALNKCLDAIEVRPEAMGASSGYAEFYESNNAGSNANSLVSTSRSQKTTSVRTITLDEFVSSRKLSISCLKIDVEGAELGVLQGAARTFSSSRPYVSLAVHPDALRQSGGTLGGDLGSDHRVSFSGGLQYLNP